MVILNSSVLLHLAITMRRVLDYKEKKGGRVEEHEYNTCSWMEKASWSTYTSSSSGFTGM